MRTRAYKTELRPTPEQAQTFHQWAGMVRYVYNWGLDARIARYAADGGRLGFFDQCKALVQLKKDPDHLWLQEAPSYTLLAALQNLDRGFSHFFRRVKAGGEAPGFPRFKSRDRTTASFQVHGTGLRVERGRVKLPKLGWVRLKERGYIPTGFAGEGRYVQATISERASRWFISVICEEEEPSPPILQDRTIAAHPGVRVHLTAHVTDVGKQSRRGKAIQTWESNPDVGKQPDPAEHRFENPRTLAKHHKRLRRAQRRLARRQKGSKNREKAKREVARIHARVSNIRSDHTHKATHAVAVKLGARTLLVQDWDVRGMMQQEIERVPRRVARRLRQAIADANMSEMARQLRYKADWQGTDVIVVPGDYPVSRRCSSCGAVKDQMESVLYVCEVCGLEIERETNAAINLLAWLEEQAVEEEV